VHRKSPPDRALHPTNLSHLPHSASSFLLALAAFCALLSPLPGLTAASCPMNYLINPCRRLEERITCDGEYRYSLTTVFDKLNRSLQHEEDRIFEEFILNNTDISELPDGVFGDIRFKRIKLVDALSLRRIGAGAFGGNGHLVEEFIAQGESLLGEDAF